jgi:hypothetical protein
MRMTPLHRQRHADHQGQPDQSHEEAHDVERIQLEAAKAILDRHLGRPAIQADISLHRGVADAHLAALLEVARKRRAEPIDLDEREILDITPRQSDPK